MEPEHLPYTLVIGIRVLLPTVITPHLLAPESYIVEILVRVTTPGAWVTTNNTIDASGNVADTIPVGVVDCTPPREGGVATLAGPTQACFEQLASPGYRQEVTYQPRKQVLATPMDPDRDPHGPGPPAGQLLPLASTARPELTPLSRPARPGGQASRAERGPGRPAW